MSLADGVGGATSLTDGRQLDLTPTFNPSGDAILFSSDRGGGPMQIWSIPVDGQSGATRLTAGNADHLWPTLDTSPKAARLLPGARPGPGRAALVFGPGRHGVRDRPRRRPAASSRASVPRNDALAFVQFNDQSKKTDICRTGDKGGVVQKVTDTPDI